MLLLFTLHRARVVGEVPRLVHCASCGTEYVYRLARRAEGQTGTFYFIGEDRARSKAALDAQEALAEGLRSESDAVPCPNCWLYQPEMVDAARRQFRWWAEPVGRAFLFAAAVVALGLMGYGVFADWGTGVALAAAFGGATLSVGIGLAFLWWRWFGPIHPNRWPESHRRAQAQSLACERSAFNAAQVADSPDTSERVVDLWVTPQEIATACVVSFARADGPPLCLALSRTDRDGDFVSARRVRSNAPAGGEFRLRVFSVVEPGEGSRA